MWETKMNDYCWLASQIDNLPWLKPRHSFCWQRMISCVEKPSLLQCGSRQMCFSTLLSFQHLVLKLCYFSSLFHAISRFLLILAIYMNTCTWRNVSGPSNVTGLTFPLLYMYTNLFCCGSGHSCHIKATRLRFSHSFDQEYAKGSPIWRASRENRL